MERPQTTSTKDEEIEEKEHKKSVTTVKKQHQNPFWAGDCHDRDKQTEDCHDHEKWFLMAMTLLHGHETWFVTAVTCTNEERASVEKG